MKLSHVWTFTGAAFAFTTALRVGLVVHEPSPANVLILGLTAAATVTAFYARSAQRSAERQ